MSYWRAFVLVLETVLGLRRDPLSEARRRLRAENERAKSGTVTDEQWEAQERSWSFWEIAILLGGAGGIALYFVTELAR